MNNEKLNADLDHLTAEMKSAADLEIAEITARCREIESHFPILTEQMKQVVESSQAPIYDSVSDTNSRLAKILSREMAYEELARYAAEGWSWASYMEDAYEKQKRIRAIENEVIQLSDEMDQLKARRDVLISTFDEVIQTLAHRREVMEAEVHGFKASRTIKASNGGKTRVKNDPRTVAKATVKEAWADWQSGKTQYKSKEDFAKIMLSIHEGVLTSNNVITNWCRDWEKM